MTYELEVIGGIVDIYEPDDVIPKPIIIGETQTHSLYPDGDVDMVWFGVKEGRLYALGTSNLAVGTDTAITVTINGDTSFWNDDIGLYFLESEVRFMPEMDATAVATITKGISGLYGPDKTYDLDLTWLDADVDEFEPDEIRPKPIAYGEIQEHNFYPADDVDKVKFVAKGGHHWAVYTFDLAALGVDTYVNVEMDGYNWANDDWQPGTGIYESAVCFQAPYEGVATVTITNTQGLYSPDNTYKITVYEQPILEVSPTSLDFGTVMEGDPSPPPMEVNINNTGAGDLTWVATEDADWLDIAPSSGAAPSTMSVSVDTTGLTAGLYTDTIAIRSPLPCVVDSPQTVTVTLRVVAPTPTPTSTPTPTPCWDEYEPDDTWQQANWIEVNKAIQSHNFHTTDDRDYVKFVAETDNIYTIRTLNLSEGNDTILTLYDTDGTTQLADNDDDPYNPPASKIVWLCPTAGTYFVKAAPWYGIGGCDMTYELEVIGGIVDIYEPDDVIPKPIIIGETQTHSLYPDGDVDMVEFGVKEGRLYALGTSNLAVGTDTTITVTINGEICQTTDYYRCVSDDIGPGFLESEVRFVPGVDATAVATISKGISGYYGPDKTYDLRLDLLSVDVDRYEPDDITPKPIIDREPQEHNFYPDGDRDLVKFPAKPADGEERWYGIFTSNLAPGVDTKLEVVMDGVTMAENDDYDPGSGNFASTVCFSVTTSGVPTVTITNLDQFGPTKSYTVTLVEEPFIGVNPDSLTFNLVEGGPDPAPQTISVTVPGGGNLFWQASESTDWLEIGPIIDKTPSIMHVIITGTTVMPSGFYSGAITIAPLSIPGAPCGDSESRTVPVYLVIAPASSPRPEGMASLIPGLAHLAHRLQIMYERMDIFLPLYWKEWDGLRRSRP
jgi:hypothetical protein